MNLNLIPSLTKTLSTVMFNRKISCMSYLRLKKVQKFNLYKCVERFYCKKIDKVKEAVCKTPEEKDEVTVEVSAIDSDSNKNVSEIDSLFEEELKEKNSEPKEMVTFYIKNPLRGETYKITGEVGISVLEAAEKANIDVAGACGGKLACTTCHMYLDDELMETLKEAQIPEQDMLDKATFVKETSRLTCQIIVCKELEGRVFTLPPGTVNFNVDGYAFKSH